MFERLIGNKSAKDILRRMLTAQRVPGALLFAGENGIGKKLFALELAKALNCRAPQGVEACDACASCTRIAQSTFPEYGSVDDNKEKIVWSDHTDVGLVRPHNKLIRVAQMRELEREANFRPYEGRARVFLIEEADRLNEASSNALLKTLEEPPASSHLILITSRPAALLTTIRSRCQTIRFAPLTALEIETHLLAGKQISPADARLLARAARGSIGRALTINIEHYRQQRDAMLDVLDALAITVDRVRLLRAAEELNDAKRKDEYEPRLEVLETLIHDAWTLALGLPATQLVNEDIHPQLKKIGVRLDSPRAAAWLTQIQILRGQLASNINRKVATDALFLSMAETRL